MINQLINYGLRRGLIEAADVDYVANALMDLLQLKEYMFEECADGAVPISEILLPILDRAVELGLIKNDTSDERDLFDMKVMGLLTPRPSEVNRKFSECYETSPQAATDYFYDFSKATDYIRTERIKKDKRWKVKTAYGTLDMTINLSKPEKDPKTIALAKLQPVTNYPSCLLCKENVGFAGHLSHPARQNHRIIPLDLVGERWYLQYSPYVYYNEHAIILKEEHEPIKISKKTFARLLDFVGQFPHYFIGSNADLPIVGGSILTHDHFQGGRYRFAMDDATVLESFEVHGVSVSLLNWPLTTLRLKSSEADELVELGGKILGKWRGYSDETLGIKAYTGDAPHNTITPIARYRDGFYELDLVLRNNRTSGAHPDGIYHPHQQYHHLKKENIGLIEVMGLAVLPGRLVEELAVVVQALFEQRKALLSGLEKHLPWYEELVGQAAGLTYKEIEILVNNSIGLKFAEILACCGVFKLDAAGINGVRRFMEAVNA